MVYEEEASHFQGMSKRAYSAPMTTATADLMDDHAEQLEVAEPLFRDFGGRLAFEGPIYTLKAFEDNSLVREALAQPGHGQVLVVDGGGSLRCAMVGDNLAQLGIDNGWSGIVVFGCIRDSAIIKTLDIGLKALATCPRKSIKLGMGTTQVRVTFAGVTFAPGAYLYADEDGIVIAPEKIP